MNPTHFFTLGYYPEYLLTGIIIGIVIGIYAFFRVRYALNDSKLSKNKVMIISAPISIFAFICCLNIWSNAAIYTLYIFLCSLFADIIRLIVKYSLKDKYPKVYKKLKKRLETGWEPTFKLLEQGKEEGLIREDADLTIFKIMMEASLERFFEKNVMKGSGRKYNDYLNEVVDILLNGISV